MQTYQWRVKKSEHGLSLENFIYKQLGDWSHSRVKNAIDHKRAFVNGRNVFVSKWNVKASDRVTFAPSTADTPAARAGRESVTGNAQIEAGRYRFVDVLFEDTYLICVNKPAFIDYESYMDVILSYLKRKNAGKGHPYVGAMHRLDKETSGVMVFTKKKIANTLADQFRERKIRKSYLALVSGAVTDSKGIIKKPIEKGYFAEGKKVRIAEDEDEGKHAETHFMVKERYEKATLLQVEIKTGRTHQIRIHMESVGHPLVGDKLYGDTKTLPFKRQALHAEFLEFRHPITNLKIKIQAPLPKDIQDLIENLREGV